MPLPAIVPFLPLIGTGISAIGAGLSSAADRRQREREQRQNLELQREQMGMQGFGLAASMRNNALMNATRYDFMRSMIDASTALPRPKSFEGKTIGASRG